MSTQIQPPSFKPTVHFLPVLSDHKLFISQWLQNNNLSTKPHNDPNVYWVNTNQDNLNIALVRKLIVETQYAPFQKGNRYFIILNLDKATIEAQNALLKTLEEPPKRLQFIITATNEGAILPTILSRCLLQKPIINPNESSEDQVMEMPVLSSFAQVIELASSFKTKEKAEQKLKEWLVFLNQKNQPKNWNKSKLIHLALVQLQQNGNVRLVLENCFFQILTLDHAL